MPGEVTFLVPSLSIGDEAIDLFADRARRVRPDFVVTEANSGTVEEICSRLDGMPLAIELAAARVRALSLDDILGSLHDRFRLLTGRRPHRGASATDAARIGGLVARVADRTGTGAVPPAGGVPRRVRPGRGAGRRRHQRAWSAIKCSTS